MKKLVSILLVTAMAWPALAQYKPVDSKSTVQFSIKNFGIPVSGNFSGLQGDISFDPAHPEQATFKVSIKSAGVNTNNDLRDSHLRKEDYFDTEHYPVISFSSTRVVPDKNGSLMVYGSLTIKNHSKEIAISFTAAPAADGFLFKGQFAINRKDFGVGGSSIIGDTATIVLSVAVTKS